MVATKLLEVSSKASEWYATSGGGSGGTTTTTATTTSSSGTPTGSGGGGGRTTTTATPPVVVSNEKQKGGSISTLQQQPQQPQKQSSSQPPVTNSLPPPRPSPTPNNTTMMKEGIEFNKKSTTTTTQTGTSSTHMKNMNHTPGSSSSSASHNQTGDTSSSSVSSLWDYTHQMADSTYSSITDMISSSWKYYETWNEDEYELSSTNKMQQHLKQQDMKMEEKLRRKLNITNTNINTSSTQQQEIFLPRRRSSFTQFFTLTPSKLSSMYLHHHHQNQQVSSKEKNTTTTTTISPTNTKPTTTTTTTSTKTSDHGGGVPWMMTMMMMIWNQNPYNCIHGRQVESSSSMGTIRDFIAMVPARYQQLDDQNQYRTTKDDDEKCSQSTTNDNVIPTTTNTNHPIQSKLNGVVTESSLPTTTPLVSTYDSSYFHNNNNNKMQQQQQQQQQSHYHHQRQQHYHHRKSMPSEYTIDEDDWTEGTDIEYVGDDTGNGGTTTSGGGAGNHENNEYRMKDVFRHNTSIEGGTTTTSTTSASSSSVQPHSTVPQDRFDDVPIPTQQQQQQQQQRRARGGGSERKKRSMDNTYYYSPTETASQVAEGTIRALRDLALDEAVELQTALRFWTERWERPMLSYIEAGPTVWTSRNGYNHQEVGRKVSHIQAVLARRCASIGELQQQLLTAGWTQGVAQWGCLGQGSTQWAAVSAFDNVSNNNTNRIEEEGDNSHHERKRTESMNHIPYKMTNQFSNVSNISHQDYDETTNLNREPEADESNMESVHPQHQQQQFNEDRSIMKTQSKSNERLARNTVGEVSFDEFPSIMDSTHSLGSKPTKSGQVGTPLRPRNQAGIFVRKGHGGGIYVDDPGFLALWSVQAIALVRRHLYRAGNGMFILPYESNWRTGGCGGNNNFESDDQIVLESEEELLLPVWAKPLRKNVVNSFDDDDELHNHTTDVVPRERTQITISDLPLMVNEVHELVEIMEDIMHIQRRRRLDRLRAPGWLRCNWYILAAIVPTTVLITHSFGKKEFMSMKVVFKQVVGSVTGFFREHVQEPLMKIANELLKGRECFSDNNARMEAMSSLRKMLDSWLKDTFPDMLEETRIKMAESMDVTLLEQKKEEYLKSAIYELNNIVRLSFIEMQYMKKEVMNALHAMDEMVSANDINMNLAAVTPAVLVVYVVDKFFRFISYAFLKLGKSREETYASFRHLLTDIERLLVMRDNPPKFYISPVSNNNTGLNRIESDTYLQQQQHQVQQQQQQQQQQHYQHQPPSCVLGRDDLGMLMLLIHECRSIMSKNKRRFSPAIIRSVAEDLAELAGERGAVSVQQQLHIIERMCRSYPFLKVISTGNLFHFGPILKH